MHLALFAFLALFLSACGDSLPPSPATDTPESIDAPALFPQTTSTIRAIENRTTPARPPTARAVPTQTPTRGPGTILIAADLNAEERRMIQDGLNLLQACAPNLFNYVRTFITEIQRGKDLRNATGYVYTGSSIVYLPQSGSINDPIHYKDSMRTFVAATLFVHEARHIERGEATTEPDAYQFELQVFIPACKPNDIGDAWNSQYEQLKHYVSWRASLPYPGEPPRNVTPPPLRPP